MKFSATATTLAGKDFLKSFTVALTTLLSGWLEKAFGSGVNQIAFGSVTWADLSTTLIIVFLVSLVHVATHAYVRHKSNQAKPTDNEAQAAVRRNVLKVLGKPLGALIWVYGIYIAATPLLLRIPEDEGLRAVQRVFDQMFDLGLFAVLFWLCFRFTRVLEARLTAWAAKTESKLDDLFVPLLGRALRIMVPVVGIIFALPILDLPPQYAAVLARGTSILLIVAVALIAFQAVSLSEDAVRTRFDMTVADNLRARKFYTQVHMICKVFYVIITLFTIASVLMLFEEVRRFGTSILASAGVAGVIIGFAAQKAIANIFAGFQLAMTQPIRLDDVVIVESEWGRIEEITLTYVVIRIWDERRLVVPLSYFIEKPFENWTRTSSSLLGSVFVWVDYSLPMEEIRRALKGIIESNPLWDKRFWNLQVSDATEKTMQIRVLATAADSSKAWDLRCAIREQLISYIQEHYPQSLPQLRGLNAGALADNGRSIHRAI